MSSDTTTQPIYLFADSQGLFWRNNGVVFIEAIRQHITAPLPKAAYIGASNGDLPEYFSIFEAAMEGIGIHECQFVHSAFSHEEQSFLAEADVIVLAGGDVAAGWKAFESTGLKESILQRHRAGAVLVGVSAGAVQLGLYGVVREASSSISLIETFKLIPFIIGAHDEGNEWEALANTVRLLEGTVTGIGIPTGGGLVYYPDQSVKAVRHPLHEFSVVSGKLRSTLLVPRTGGSADTRIEE